MSSQGNDMGVSMAVVHNIHHGSHAYGTLLHPQSFPRRGSGVQGFVGIENMESPSSLDLPLSNEPKSKNCTDKHTTQLLTQIVHAAFNRDYGKLLASLRAIIAVVQGEASSKTTSP